MSNDPPPPYPGGPSAPLIEEKDGLPFPAGSGPPPGLLAPSGGVSPAMAQPQAAPPPPSEFGPPPYEPYEPLPQPGFIPPHMAADGSVPYMPPGGYYMPPGPHAAAGYFPAVSPFPPPGSQTATVLVPSGAATTVTVLPGEIFQAAPVPTVCPHCQQAITTKISHEVGLVSILVGLFCCFVGCDLGCCLIPCLLDDFKDVTHTCPNCKAYIYTYKRMC